MHIGNAIYNELKRQGRTVVWFAKTLPCDRSTAYDIFNRSTIDTEQLSRICKMLNHNFFTDLQHEMQRNLQEKV